MINFEVIEDSIELAHYSPDTTLPELVAELEEFRKNNELKTRKCKGCGLCCQDNIPVLGFDMSILVQGLGCSLDELKSKYLIIPEPIEASSRRKSIAEMAMTPGMSGIESVLLYEYNNAEPLILNKQDNGDCCLLKVAECASQNDDFLIKLEKVQKRPGHTLRKQKLCSLYSYRPFSCGLYLCNMGEKLAFIQEMIIRQGTWHAYSMLGWISEEDISHNPFLKVRTYDELYVKDFDYQLQSALDQLFFYF